MIQENNDFDCFGDSGSKLCRKCNRLLAAVGRGANGCQHLRRYRPMQVRLPLPSENSKPLNAVHSSVQCLLECYNRCSARCGVAAAGCKEMMKAMMKSQGGDQADVEENATCDLFTVSLTDVRCIDQCA